MQATVSAKQFGFNRFGTTMMAFGIAAGIALGAAGLTVTDNLPAIGTGDQTIVLPKAHSSANQGEGMRAGTSAIVAAVQAHTSVEQGDGIVGGNRAVSAPLTARTSQGQGEGIVGGLGNNLILTAPVVAHYSAGMGEGWTAYGQPDTAIRAHTSDGQGEGWVGAGRP